MRYWSTPEKNGLRSWLDLTLPTNVICWARGHAPVATVQGSAPRREGLADNRWILIRCRVCSLRYNDFHQASRLDSMASDLVDHYRRLHPKAPDSYVRGLARKQVATETTQNRIAVLERDGSTAFCAAAEVDRRTGWDTRTVQLHSQLVWPKLDKATGKRHGHHRNALGFQLHFGNQFSETPIDAHVNLGPLAAYVTVGGIGGRFAELVGRGHKRDLALSIDKHQISWKVWYDDDMGHDDHHRCDSWRRPKLWPWSAGRRKSRQWMCLRRGHLDVNPLTALWGHRSFHYTDLDTTQVAVPVGEFPGDTYLAEVKLQRQDRHRDHGPAWARRVETSHAVAWEVRPHGIPVRNHDWKGDGIIASAESLPADFVPLTGSTADARAQWTVPAVQSLVARIKADRLRYGYRPPRDRAAAE